uniref:Uncharacterized protein n=1 Tax=Thermosporothrix sp. COM3 TaxID=2490863 RepID=A0A455SX79_9CHLR|nr:hypothetical protein KTC_64800 [Thermosporothrix sp. COM3]
MDRENGGRLFRHAWIAGVKRYYPGTPKPGYIAPWEETPAWEQEACKSVFELVVGDLHLHGIRSPEEGGQRVHTFWLDQIKRLIEQPKPSYLAPWEALPRWQQHTDMDIYQQIVHEAQQHG